MNECSQSLPGGVMSALFPGTQLLALTAAVPRSACGGRAGAQAWGTLPASGRVLPSIGGGRPRGVVSWVWAGAPGARRSPRMRSDSPAMAAPEEPLRRRKVRDTGREPGSPPGSGRDPAGFPAQLRAGTFWLTRIVLLRALAFVYCESPGPPSVLLLCARPRTPPVTLPRPAPRPPLRRVPSGAGCLTLPLCALLSPVRGSG